LGRKPLERRRGEILSVHKVAQYINLWYSLLSPADEIGMGYCFGVVRPSVLPSIHLSVRISFRASSLQLLAEIQRNFMGIINIKRRCAYRRLVPVKLFNSKLWPLISYALCVLSKNRFLATSLQLLAGIQQNFVETFLILRWDAHIVALLRSDTLTQSYGPCSIHRAKFVTPLLLCNFWP
jgi:hypothetical protein